MQSFLKNLRETPETTLTTARPAFGSSSSTSYHRHFLQNFLGYGVHSNHIPNRSFLFHISFILSSLQLNPCFFPYFLTPTEKTTISKMIVVDWP